MIYKILVFLWAITMIAIIIMIGIGLIKDDWRK